MRPLDRIFGSIRTHAAQIFKALDVDAAAGGQGASGGGGGAGGAPGGGDEGEMNTIEAAVLKMSKIVAHFTGGGGQGAAMLKTMAAGADQSTKQWLATMVPTMAGADAPGSGAIPAKAGPEAGAAAEPSSPSFRIKSVVPPGSRNPSNARPSVVAFLSRSSTKAQGSGEGPGALDPGWFTGRAAPLERVAQDGQ